MGEFWVKLLIFCLLCSTPTETRKQTRLTKGQFEPPVKAVLKDYGQVRRHSHSVYEEKYEPLHSEWSTDNDDDDSWGDLHWSLDDSIDQDFDDEFDDYDKYADDVNFFDQELHRISDVDKQLKKIQQLDLDRKEVKSRDVPRSRSASTDRKQNFWELSAKETAKNDDRRSIKPETAASATKVGKRQFQENDRDPVGKFNKVIKKAAPIADDVGFDILRYTTDMFDCILETLTTVTESITSTAKEMLKYVLEKGEDLFNYITDDGIRILHSWDFEFTKEIFANKANEVIAYITEVAANFASALTIKEIPSFFTYLDISPVTTRINGLKDYGLDTVNVAAQVMAEFIESNIKNRFQRTSESVITMADQILTKATDLFVCIQEATANSLSAMADTVSLGISYITGFIRSTANTGLAMILNVPHFLADFILSVGNSEFVLILNEEMIEPMHGSLTEIHLGCMCPLVDYITNVVFDNVSTMLNGTSRVVLKYAIKMKKVNDQAIVVTSSLINNGLDFVMRCNTKECLLLTIQSCLQDEKVFYKLVWLIIYIILTLLFLYYSYVSNKVTLQFCIFMIKVILKRVTCMLCCIFRYCKKPPKLVDSATYCDISNVEVRVTEIYYNKLIAASERKLQQLKEIRALAIELEDLQCTNMAGYLEMYEKQEECDELEAQTAIENEFVNTETLSLL